MEKDYIINNPDAKVLMTSLRKIGYSFNSAVSDVIDNSVSAYAKNIYIDFPVSLERCIITIFDDGIGMSEEELLDAMKYGSTNKEDGRNDDDLGRFGCGLKTASLSICKKLTVISKKDSTVNCFVWDLDFVQKIGEWALKRLTIDEFSKIEGYEKLQFSNSGTLVIWENFDVFNVEQNDLLETIQEKIEPLYKYISLIFHRYIEKGVNFHINDRLINAIDPFLVNHKKTKIQREIVMPLEDSNGVSHNINITPFILPFQTDMSKNDIELVGGTEDYRNNQGFYIYRNERLIIWGTWFGERLHELTKNARIRIDIPNKLDDIWDIDVKKQNATIPLKIKKRLKRAVFEAMDSSRKVQTHRTKTINKELNVDYVWNRVIDRDNNVLYEVNKDSIIWDEVKSAVDDSTWRKIELTLSLLEQSLPYQDIYVDKADNNIKDSEEINEDILSFGRMIVEKSKQKGLSQQEIIEQLNRIDIYKGNDKLIEKLLEVL